MAPETPPYSRIKLLAFRLFGVVLCLAVFEVASYFACALLTRYELFFVPSGSDGYAEYLAGRDPVLGWPSPAQFGKDEYDARGSRTVPSWPDPNAQPACVSVFGDSFTFGTDGTAGQSYPNVLAQELACRVNNFGVGGYGTDQSLLRYRFLAQDQAKFVVLGHYSEDIVRNVNQLRGLNAHARFGLKPRFVLETGQLRLVPLPRLSAAEFSRIEEESERLLPYEFFRPGGEAGIVSLRFPYSWSLLRVVGQYRVQAALRGVPSYAPFYDSEHPSGALSLTLAILAAFAQEAAIRGQTPLVLLIPDIADLNALRAGHPLHYEPLTRALRERKIETLDAGSALHHYLGGRDPCDIYTACGFGHLKPEGNAVLARLVADRLRAIGPPPSSLVIGSGIRNRR